MCAEGLAPRRWRLNWTKPRLLAWSWLRVEVRREVGEGGDSGWLLRGWLTVHPDEKNCSDCICVKSEFHCGDPGCQTCTHHPCPPGQEAVPEGKFKFGFRCVDCAVGTFSSGHEGRCRPWTDCDQFGFLTMFHGNKTHNAVCFLGSLPAEPHGQLTILLVAMATCILVLTTAQLSLHIWQLRRKHTWPQETQPLLEVLRPPAEDACSCQFPEEERGERLEKDERGDPWV
nr:tumor necrosis factor receptor superfamily member 18 isoform X1 [Marmota flaviventris]